MSRFLIRLNVVLHLKYVCRNVFFVFALVFCCEPMKPRTSAVGGNFTGMTGEGPEAMEVSFCFCFF